MGAVTKTLSFMWALFKFILIPLAWLTLMLGVTLEIYFIAAVLKGSRPKTGQHLRIHRPPWWKNLFYYFPVRFIKDWFDRDPEYFTHQGCVIFTGRQGYGKTIAMVEQCNIWQREYPKAKVITNLNYSKQNDELSNWTDLIDYKNGIQGVICLIDEMQNWFSSNQSKNFPPEMLEVITQNRKNRRVIMGTAQSFNRLAKPIREQATEVRKCFTAFGCITFVHRVTADLDSNGDVVKWKHRGFYYFVHTDDLRDCYDTYKVIESLRLSGFQEKKADFSFTVKS